MTRSEYQGLAAHALAKNRRLICQWATGCGKSQVALRFIKDNPWMNVLILVPEQNNIENWRNEFSKFDVPDDHVTIICYASLHKYKNTAWDLLVLDEVPHMDTDKRKKLCESVRGDYILALGAVVDEDEMATLEGVYGKFIVSKISLEKAIELGMLPPPSVYVLHMTLDDTVPCHWLKGRMLTDKQMYDTLNRRVEETVAAYNNNANPFLKNQMLRAGTIRKRFLGSLKEDAMRKICSRLEEKNRRFLCFCSSIPQAEALGGEHAFTSKSAASYKHLERFNNHEINSLYVVGKLIEGQNLKDIDCGVIGQLGGTQRITVQEIGRILRSDKPIIYVPVFDDTKDDSFLYTLTANIPAEYVKHYNF